MRSTFVLLKLLFANFFVFASCSSEQPNIVFILADDLGYNDVGFRNSDIITPNIDSLATDGMILDQSYVQPLCTPSRAALMTGMYPYHIGRQGAVLYPNTPTGLTLDHKLLPEYLRELGYSTHLVGKWHLGFCKPEYLPTNRGFDSHFGYWNAAEDYFTKYVMRTGKDFHDGEEDIVNDDVIGSTYSTHLYRDRTIQILDDHSSSNSSAPLFLYLAFQGSILQNLLVAPHTPHAVPEEYEDLYPHIVSPRYKTYYGMITALDEAIGDIVTRLKELSLYDNTIIVLLGDNGAPNQMFNSNFPFSGSKGTEYEGGTRTAAFLHSPLLKQKGINEKLIHITDWFPTLLTMAGIDTLPDGVDGLDQSSMLFGDPEVPSARTEMVYNIQNTNDPLGTSGAIRYSKLGPPRFNQWKLLVNQGLLQNFELYNIEKDPQELDNQILEHPDVFKMMLEKYNAYVKTMVPEDVPDSGDGNVVDGSFVTGWC